jgi:hypothetical protein
MKRPVTAVKLLLVIIGVGILLAVACGGHQESNDPGKSATSSRSGPDAQSPDPDDSGGNENSAFPDGTYSATVEYYNPETGYSATYTLDVDVQDGQVVEIHFPKGGYLDEHHITPADLDEDGDAEVEGEDGKTYSIHIEGQAAGEEPQDDADDSDDDQ